MFVEILGARNFEKLDVGLLCIEVKSAFNLEVSFRKAVMDFGATFDANRLQYNSTQILHLLLNSGKIQNDSKAIILTDLDLFVPILTYVFGEAELNGRAAIASSHRLHNEYYGLPKNEPLLQTRTTKEIIHELGHTFGLIHCKDYMCVMHSSTYVEDIDLKKASLCISCKDKLEILDGNRLK
ncbi:MAG: archaemetzincin family Zn-dependent metalloprotease [Bacteroidota bacterium]|nr:archaemetzincin family Zn-dependent metalloprotease [Bacteroidota bacterium]